MKQNKLVILDRDGVVNHDSDNYIRSVDEWQPIDRSLTAITRLKEHRYTVAIATNQSGIGRGYYDLATLANMHNKLHAMLFEKGAFVDGIFFCPHTPQQHCLCRKPASGLYTAIGKYFSVDLRHVPVVGDSRRDLEAAKAVGASPVLVQTGKGKDTVKKLTQDEEIPVYDDLASAVDAIIANAV